MHAAITDVTDGRVAFRLAGPSAREVLAKGCPLDLHPRAFAPGRCAQSLLAKASVLIHLVDDGPERGPSFDVYVARSFAAVPVDVARGRRPRVRRADRAGDLTTPDEVPLQLCRGAPCLSPCRMAVGYGFAPAVVEWTREAAPVAAARDR